jgi:SNF2 family DNA or RNA helicase
MRSDFGERCLALLPISSPFLPHHQSNVASRYEAACELGIYSSSGAQEPIYDANGTRPPLYRRHVRTDSSVETSFTGRAVVPWHVMITTYSYFEADTGSTDRAFLRSIPFDVMALDEAHNIKNAASSRHRSRHDQRSFRIRLNAVCSRR